MRGNLGEKLNEVCPRRVGSQYLNANSEPVERYSCELESYRNPLMREKMVELVEKGTEKRKTSKKIIYTSRLKREEI